MIVWYGASEAEKYLLLTEKTDYLAALLVIKNAGYGIVLFIFLLWPFIFRGEKKQKSETRSTQAGVCDKLGETQPVAPCSGWRAAANQSPALAKKGTGRTIAAKNQNAPLGG